MLPRPPPVRFDTQTLSLFSRRLLNCPVYRLHYKKDAGNAAVLMPLCLVQDEPSVLFTVRNMNMRTHRGEVSFPGGKADATDPSHEHTALRETMEETGLAPSSIDILGRYSTLPNKTGSLRVHPFVGFIRGNVDAARIQFNQDEVANVFTLPLTYLMSPGVRQIKQFRDSTHQYTTFKMPDHIQGEREIWGLTSFILDGVLRRLLPKEYGQVGK